MNSDRCTLPSSIVLVCYLHQDAAVTTTNTARYKPTTRTTLSASSPERMCIVYRNAFDQHHQQSPSSSLLQKDYPNSHKGNNSGATCDRVYSYCYLGRQQRVRHNNSCNYVQKLVQQHYQQIRSLTVINSFKTAPAFELRRSTQHTRLLRLRHRTDPRYFTDGRTVDLKPRVPISCWRLT